MKTNLKRYCFAAEGSVQASRISDALNTFCTVNQNKNIRTEHYQYGKNRFIILETPLCIDLEEDIRSFKTVSSELSDVQVGVPLERIFKKNSENPDLSSTTEAHKRFVMTLEIRNDPLLLKEYIEMHKPDKVWPQILKNMEIMGVLEMELYRCGYQAYLIMDMPLHFDMEKDGGYWAGLPKEQEWQNYVAKFQKVNPESKAVEKWNMMEYVKV